MWTQCAVCGAALSLGTNVKIVDSPGYAPLINDENLIKVCADAAKLAIPEYEFKIEDCMSSGSTDMGDFCGIMPVVHPYSAGTAGNSHGNNYKVEDPVAACVDSARLQMGMLLILLSNGAKRAYQVIDEYKPQFASKEECLKFVDSLNSCGDRIEYADITATINIS